MRIPISRYWCLSLLLMSGCGKSTSTVASSDASIVPSTSVVMQGKRAEFEFYPRLGGTQWTILSGPFTGSISSNGTFRAPLTLPAERMITIEASNGSERAQATVLLQPGPVEPADCLGPGQPDARDPANPYVQVDELPEPIVRVPPIYPDAAREAGVQGTVTIRALVCACGEISEVRVVQSVPMLDQASIEAVSQWFFKPAQSSGEAVAVWVHIPVRFTLN